MKRLFTLVTPKYRHLEGYSQLKQNSLVRMMVMAVAMMMLAPSAVKADVVEINFNDAALGAYNHEISPNSGNYKAAEFIMGDTYSDIAYAKVGNVINYKYVKNGSVDISRLAFAINTNGKANAHDTGYGFYLRAERNTAKKQGLYTGNGNSIFAVLGLKPGDNVKILYAASPNIGQGGANIRINNESISRTWCDQLDNAGAENEVSIDINFIGDLNVTVNVGTFIEKITITTNPAQYEIKTNGNESTFEFTKDGTLEENDYAVPYLAASFGSINDYLLVQNGTAHMIKANGSEDLVTDPDNNYLPSAGSFYAFKPTAGGHLKLEGSYQGQVHLFIYDPSRNGNNYNWVPGNSQQGGGQFYVATYSSGNIEFDVEKDKIYYICQDNNNNNERGNAFHLHKFTFTHTFGLAELAKVIDNVDSYQQGQMIELTKVEGVTSETTGTITVKRCTGNIVPTSFATIISDGKLKMGKPTFVDGTDHAGTVIIDVNLSVGEATFVVTFPYHADYRPAGYTDPNRSYGHTWNFIDPRNSDSNSGNSKVSDGNSGFNNGPATTGILSIGQKKNTNSTFYYELMNREWTYSQRITGEAGGFHDPYYANVWDMEGDNADMIWETEGLWFDTGTNLSCINNESNPLVWDNQKTPKEQVGNPLNFLEPRLLKDDGETPADPIRYDANGKPVYEDPDRYVGLMPVTDGKKSSFTIPGLKPGDRVLIFMKSGEGSGDNGIFLNITGAKDALGKQIEATDLYKAGGTNWQHNRYEGCYHFIKDETKDPGSEYGRMTFSMNSGSMCKLLYIRIYTGQRIPTNNIVSTGYKQDANGDDVYEKDPETDELKKVQDAGRILFINEKGAQKGQYSNMSLRFRGKGQQQKTIVLTRSGNLNYSTTELKKINNNGTTNDSHFTVSGDYSQAVGYTSQVGEIGMFRMREMDVEYTEKYVADFSDRNFTVGYRDKVEYPYTWDFTDIKGSSQAALTNEANNYPIAAAAQDEYGKAPEGGISPWDISLFDASGNMKVNTGFDPITDNLIFAPHKIGFGNQLWAGDGVIPETRGLWFHSEDDSETGYTSEYSSSLYNDCLQITTDGIRFANVPDDAGKRVAWWNYKMVVPDVPANGAVYLRMKRDTSVPDDAKTYSTIDNAYVPFLAARFQFASQSSKTDMVKAGELKNGTNYSFYKVPNTTDEYIVAVKNNTGSINHLTFTLNGWIVEKVAVSTDQKSVNSKGWASESRSRNIDAALTPYFTGKTIKTYLAGSPNYDNRTLLLTDISTSESNHVLPAGTGCVLFNETDKNKAEIVAGNFHLFVPDMHDGTELANPNATLTDGAKVNMLKPQLTQQESMPRTETVGGTEHTIYVLAYKYYDLDQNGNTKSNTMHEGPEMFYRIAANQSIGLKANSAYLVLPTSKVKPQNALGAKYTFVFDDWDNLIFDDPNAIATEIEGMDASNGVREYGQEGWYNMNGQKLNGRPTESGIYIVNGKKLVIK